MEIKKSPKADLENKRVTFVLIGLVFVLAVVYVGLEWTKTEITKYEETDIAAADEDEEMIEVTFRQETPPPPPPPEPETPEILEIVENDQEDSGPIQSSETDQNTEIKILPPPPAPVVVDDPDEQKIFQIVEKMPSFPGGDAEMMKFISKSLRYPAVAQENGIEGRVVVSFVVEKDGKIADVKVVRGRDPALDKEAIRVVQAMPKWDAGEQRGKPVRVSYILPIVFKLQK